jgi:hypothetical protein
MRFELSEVLPWGRSFDEYIAMFDLKDNDLDGRILGCADGPASFNAELNRRGGRVVSCDPIYRFTREQLSARIEQAFFRPSFYMKLFPQQKLARKMRHRSAFLEESDLESRLTAR